MRRRNAIAEELQNLLEQLQQLTARAEALAASSGIIEPKYFRGSQTMLTMAAGELDAKGLLTPHAAPEKEPTA